LDLITLASNIANSALLIDAGRRGFATRGKEQEGRISYEDGISMAMTSFQQAQTSANPQALILAEYTFLSQELQLSDKTDKDTHDSLTKAIESFDDAFLSVRALDESNCKSVDSFFPHNGKYRVGGYPKDSFHIACIGHKTRLRNILKAPGIDVIEKALLKLRFNNLSVAQTGYVEKQKTALTKSK